MESKTVFVGALYEFGSEARDTIIGEYREQYSDGAAKPFISYDERTHLFSFTCDRTDSTAVSNFYSSMYSYVEVFEKKTNKNPLNNSPLLKPISGTFIEDTLLLDDEENSEDLLGVAEDSDSEMDGQAPAHNNSFWAPLKGSSKMLTRDIARAITESTEADLFPEHDRNRVVIMGGNPAEALTKLSNLEPLMELLRQQAQEGANRPSTNILMLAALDDLSTLDFTLVAACPLATERIVVDPQARPNLHRKSMTQVLHRDVRHGPWLTPANMTEDAVRNSATISDGLSQIWNNRPYASFGDPTSAKPASVPSAQNTPFGLPLQKFVMTDQAHIISKWTDNIIEGIDPEAIAVEAPVETVLRVPRDDSDDEEDVKPPPATMRIPMVDSDDEEEIEIPITPATKRVPMFDSDDEDEEAVVSTPVIRHIAETKVREQSEAPVTPTTKQVSLIDSDDKDERAVEASIEGAVGFDVEHGFDRQPSSDICVPGEPPTVQQPTWTSDPFSTFVSEEQPTPPSEPQSSTLLDGLISPLQSPHPSPPLSTSQPHQSSPHPPPHLSTPQLRRRLVQESPDLLDAQSPEAETNEYIGQSAVSMSPPKFSSPHEFDPTRYGRVRRVNYAARCMGPPPKPMTSTTPGRGRGRGADITKGSPSSRGRGAGGKEPNYSHPVLVQLLPAATVGTSTEVVRPPPGLEFRGNNSRSNSSSTGVDLLDGPLDILQVPSIRPMSTESEHTRKPASAVTKNSSSMSSGNSGASYVNTHNPPRDLARIENDQLAKLYKMREEAQDKKRLEKERIEKLKASPQVPFQLRASPSTTQRRQEDDEGSSRRVHNTMSQQGSKPGKKGKQNAPKLSEKERQQRLDEVLGKVTTTMMPSVAAVTETMSTRKKQALKKDPKIDPAAAAQFVANALCERNTSNLIQYLNPLLEASRAFPGHLKFEVQLGQVLLAGSKDLEKGEGFFSIKNWESVFSPSKQRPIATTFTNILTRNGHDIDRLLNMNPPRGLDGKGPAKLFDKLNPGPSETSYEFHCQNKESEEFWIVVDGTGKYSIRKSTSIIGTTNLHYPASIWDARVILHGTADFCEPDEETSLIVASFMQSVYVPAKESISITYRQPADNDMSVRSVTVKRTSLHSCHMLDRQDIQLQVVEVKNLFHKFHNNDKKLTQAFEKSHTLMHEHDRIHYEVSLVNTNINEMLKQNRMMETGNLTTGITGKQLLKPEVIQQFLDLTSHIVAKIDWAGLANNGTLLRLMHEQHNLSARIATATSVPGRRAVTFFAGMTSAAAGGNPSIPHDVHGIRINTKAQVGYDADGKLVLIGMGGAMVPLPKTIEEEFDVPGGELAPADSASNVGVGRQGYVSSAAAARGWAGREVRGPDFW